MKKPNIYEENTYDGFSIIEVNGRQIGKESVSDLIDALIDIHEIINTAIASGDWKVCGACDPDSSLERAEKALLKAGCTE